MIEKFNAIAPLDIDGDGVAEFEVNSNPSAITAKNAGTLWTGSCWLTVAQARELRDWLNEAIPAEADGETPECETCGDTGEIDETLGGIPTSNPHAPCPDCRPVKSPGETP